MKLPFAILCLASLFAGALQAQDYTYFVRQTQMPDNTNYDVSVDQAGSRLSEMAINPEGARFELWTVKSSPLTSYLLDTTYVNSYIPVAEVEIVSEDPYEVIPRTRADRPFTVNVTINGLSTDPSSPPAAQSVKLVRHVQPYQSKGTGKNTDRGNATLLSQGSISSNGTQTLNYALTSIQGSDRSKVRGEERFSVYSLADYQAPESLLDYKFMQVWPVASSVLIGISPGDVITETLPEFTIQLEDLYPDSWTYAQVYQGNPVVGTNGIVVTGSSILIDNSVPQDETVVVSDWDDTIGVDGIWTLEIITATPFGADRLAYVTFEVDRAMRVNGSVTSIE